MKEVLYVVELFLFKTGTFGHLGDNSGHICTSHLTVPLRDEQLGKFSLGAVHEEIFKS